MFVFQDLCNHLNNWKNITLVSDPSTHFTDLKFNIVCTTDKVDFILAKSYKALLEEQKRRWLIFLFMKRKYKENYVLKTKFMITA